MNERAPYDLPLTTCGGPQHLLWLHSEVMRLEQLCQQAYGNLQVATANNASATQWEELHGAHARAHVAFIRCLGLLLDHAQLGDAVTRTGRCPS